MTVHRFFQEIAEQYRAEHERGTSHAEMAVDTALVIGIVIVTAYGIYRVIFG